MKNISIILLIFLAYSGCSPGRSNYSKLEKYYEKSTVLHKNIFDSLVVFCKTNHTDVILRKSVHNSIRFNIHIKDAYVPVDYDSLFARYDHDSLRTLKYAIPWNVIKGFKETIYSAISADSIQTFFGDEWRVKLHPGTQGDAQYGVLISADTSISPRCDKRLSPNVCLTIRGIH